MKWMKIGDLEYYSLDDLAYIYYSEFDKCWKLEVFDLVYEYSCASSAQHAYDKFLKDGELLGETEVI